MAILYGTKWLPVVGALQVLAIYGMVRSVGATFGNVLIVSGQPEWLFYGAGTQILIALIAILMGAAKYGILGIAVVMTVALCVGVVINGLKISRVLHLGVSDWFRLVGVPLLLSLLIIGIIQVIVPNISGVWLLAKIGVAVLLYTLLVIMAYRADFIGLVREIRLAFYAK